MVFNKSIAVRLILTVGLSFLLCCSRAGETGVNPGDAPPEIKLPSLGGKEISLADFKGKTVLLNFWASWCGPCVEELPSLQRLYQQLSNRNFVVVGVGIDDNQESLGEFKQRFGLTFPILVDEGGDSKSSYKISGVPESFIISADGKLLMFPDPENSELTVRIVGPREWDSPNSIANFNKILSKPGK